MNFCYRCGFGLKTPVKAMNKTAQVIEKPKISDSTVLDIDPKEIEIVNQTNQIRENLNLNIGETVKEKPNLSIGETILRLLAKIIKILKPKSKIPNPITLSPDTLVESFPKEPSNPSSPSNPRREFVRTNPYSAYIGQRLGEGDRYRLDTHIGGGGMGQVYLASDTKLRDLPVAIKVMTSYSGSDNENLINRFQREVVFMASFRSMNIVKISDFGLTSQESPFQGSPFYVMEYLQGTTLTKRLEEVGRLSVEQAIPIIRQICAGLREAHQLGIAHRDLKPDNIYLIPNEALGEIVKILDFGIAKIVDKGATDQTSHTLTAMGAFVGTYRYASPEQCLGDSTIDHRTDIYSLGVLIYEMLSGTNPYNVKVGQNTQGYWISSHISKKAHPLRSQPGCETLSPELEAVVMKCLEKSPDDRFASIDELEIALRTIL